MTRWPRIPGAERSRAARRGLTLVELILATGLLTLVMIAVFTLLDGSLSLWRRVEVRRNLTEQASGVMELLAHDLSTLEPGERGDVWIDWARFDTDDDGVGDHAFPRLRLVRQASAAEVARMTAGWDDPPVGPSLLEVCWAVTPASGGPDARAEGVMWRGERLLDDDERLSFFDPGFFGRGGRPAAGALEEVTGGLLWFGPLMATQTSIVYDGWTTGSELEDAATSWDAWDLDRPDAGLHPYNELGAGMPQVKDVALLPRRVRVELEFERAIDRRRRTRTTSMMEPTDSSFTVEDGDLLPREEEAHVLIGGEWMRMVGLTGNRVTVRRARRGTEPTIHPPGALVHWGPRTVREVPVRLYRDDWNL